MPIFCVECYAPKGVRTRKSPSYFARRLVDSCHDDAHPDTSTLHTRAVRPHTCFVESVFFIPPVRAIADRKCSKWCQLFRVFRGRALLVRGGHASIFFSGSDKAKGGALAPCLDGLAHLEYHGTSSPWWRRLYIATALALNRSAHRFSGRGESNTAT